jgi:MYXO-CTERM domain-containing protein
VRSLALVTLVTLVASSSAIAGNAPIINGTVDSGDPAVVQIYAYPSTKDTLYTCTGIVIAPKAILTAAHCLDHTGYIFGVFFGPDANAYGGQIVEVEPFLKFAASVHIDPDYNTQAPFMADIGVLLLTDPTDVVPLDFSRAQPTDSLVNAPVRIIGYGNIVANTTNNAKYAADTVVAGLDSGADTILVGDATSHNCVGDSGGPVLQNNVVLGVDSYSAAGCTDPAHFRRTDFYADFIDSIAGTSSGTGSGSGSGSGSDMGSGSGSGSGVPMGGGAETGDNSGCSTTTGAPNAALFVIGAFVLLRRRRK